MEFQDSELVGYRTSPPVLALLNFGYLTKSHDTRLYLIHEQMVTISCYFAGTLVFLAKRCYGMLGLPEGLAQHIATIATVLVNDSVMKREGLRFTFVGQGDNILQGMEYPVHEMVVRKPSPGEVQRIESLNANILKSLIREYSNFGLTLKREETWSHYRASIYGKDIRADGRVLRGKRRGVIIELASVDRTSERTGECFLYL